MFFHSITLIYIILCDIIQHQHTKCNKTRQNWQLHNITMDGTDKQQYKFVGICLKLTIIVLQQLLYLVIRIQKNIIFDYYNIFYEML